jgi:ribosomal protein S18 acetylase RimI-like enzyme
MTLEYRVCQPSDVNEAIPLMYSAGPEAFRYVFSVDYAEQATDFLRYAFVKGSGEFGYEDHIVAIDNNIIVGLVGRRSSSQNFIYTVAAAKQIIGFYGIFTGLKVIFRGLRFELIVSPPTKGRVCLHNLGVCPDSQGKGYGQQMIKHFMANEKNKKNTHVCLDVAATNPRAKSLYQRLGFVVKKCKKGKLENKYGRGVDHEYMEIEL